MGTIEMIAFGLFLVGTVIFFVWVAMLTFREDAVGESSHATASSGRAERAGPGGHSGAARSGGSGGHVRAPGSGGSGGQSGSPSPKK